jgi:manganese efflux pump family protein
VSPLAILVLAFSMSVDAFAAAVGRGVALGRPRVGEALRTGVVFGVIEALTPLIGWAGGIAAAGFVQAIDHWIAFTLLAGVGINNLYNAVRGPGEEEACGDSVFVLVATAFGSSIDAMAVGVSLALIQVNIFAVASAIGATTFLLASAGMLVGRAIGDKCGKLAGIASGLLLCGLGSMILFDHLSG